MVVGLVVDREREREWTTVRQVRILREEISAPCSHILEERKAQQKGGSLTTAGGEDDRR